ncbi:sugar transferase [Flavobacterium sp. 7A]|uniref:sugar transferase n=1 Tax=Flavobacterium sp. 7A TaxID=2940571 RepID=UPI00222779BF|nr:sugar transferase [Flavobacterium sp. 7A]MCW2119464.1 exopolysaccharide biosynthesis polyprenyl glycosylphosphotransferase [Flavobacterium sp. 7A]
MPNNKIHFEISERKAILHLFDALFVVLALYVVGQYFDVLYLKQIIASKTCLILLVIYLNVFGVVFEMYNIQTASNEFQILKSTLLCVSSTVLVYLLTPLLSPLLPSNRLQILLFYSIVFAVLMSWRLFYVKFLASTRFSQNALLICTENEVESLIQGLENIDPHYKIVAFVATDWEETINTNPHHYVECVVKANLLTYVKKMEISEIVIASQITTGIEADLYHQLIKLLEAGKVIREYAQLYESKTYRIPVHQMGGDFYRFFPFSRSNHNKLYLFVVRIIELIIAVVGLFLGSLLLPFIVIGNSIGNRGSLLYSQERIGKDGHPFKILKLRTMVKNAETNGAVFATTNDNRITAFGKFLRKTRIDEIPQFINVLKGEMGIIGPRPERTEFVELIAKTMPFYETRHIIKPGLTGWAQVNYSYGENIDDSLVKLQYDLYYIKHRSFFLDLNITFKTITTVLFYRGQ